MKETEGEGGDFVDGGLEGSLICSGRLVEAGDFAYELERSVVNFFDGDGWIVVEKRFYVSAHD